MTNRRSAVIIAMLLLSGYLLPEARPASAPNLGNSVHIAPESSLEGELLSLLNQHRIQQNLPALALDEGLVQIARSQSTGMAQQGFISHDAPLGDLKTRLRSNGYLYRTVRENVARSKTVAYAQHALLESPSHKSNMIAVDVDRVGIGIIRSAPPFANELYITEIFASPREDYPPAAVKDMLLDKIEDCRQNGANSLLMDATLEKLALDSVQFLNIPVKKEELQNLLSVYKSELRKNGRNEIARVDASVQMLRDPKSVKILTSLLPGPTQVFGSAVRKILDDQDQPAYLVLTLIGSID
jgi:uncharacterized protein YkwD